MEKFHYWKRLKLRMPTGWGELDYRYCSMWKTHMQWHTIATSWRSWKYFGWQGRVKKTTLRQYVFLPCSNRGTQFCDCKIEGRETVTFAERLKLLNRMAWFFMNWQFGRSQNRMLLWHGSRLSNWTGILSQGAFHQKYVLAVPLSMFHLNDTCHYWPILANRLLHKCIFVVVALGWCRRI